MIKPHRNILLNPGPSTTTLTVKQALVVRDICPREKEFGELTQKVLDNLVKVVHGEKDYTSVLFAGSGTASVEAAISSAMDKTGRMLILINGAYGQRALKIARIYYEQDQIEAMETDLNLAPDLKAIEAKLAAGGFSHLFFVHHETTTGMLNPLEYLCALARSYGLITIADCMSSYGGLPIDLGKNSVDYLISSSNKCIQGMPGLSFVIANKASLEKTRDIPPKSLYLNLWGNHRYLMQQGQFQFTPPVQVLYALDQALEEYFIETEEGRCQRYQQSYQTLLQGMKALGFACYLEDESLHSGLLTSFLELENPNFDFESLHDYLYERGFTIYPGKVGQAKTFRIANIGAIDSSDIQAFLAVLKDYLQAL